MAFQVESTGILVKKLLLLSTFLISSVCFADVETIGPFGGLNNSENSFIIPSTQAQDLLNVDISDQAKSIKKRKGYGTAFTLSNATSPVHGVYSFYDSNGASVDLYFNDRNMNVSVSGGSPTVFFSTGTNGATYQCTDSAGFAYCTNSSRDSVVKVNSSTYSLLIGFTSTGSMVAVTPERLVQAGFSSFPNLIWFSKSNDFSTWAVGGNPTDPIQFTITSPGSSVKHITYAHGRVYWFKDSSFGYILEGATQGDWTVVTVSAFLGNLYNTSIYRDEILYFQGNDGHFYAYDGSNLVKLSKDIQGTISTTQGRSSNFWTQATQSDFAAGITNPQGFISSSIVSGQLMGSSFTVTETSNADFLQGSFSNTYSTGNFVWLSTDNHNYKDTVDAYSFEAAFGSPYWAIVSIANGLSSSSGNGIGTDSCGTVVAQQGSQYGYIGTADSVVPTNLIANVYDSESDSLLFSSSFTFSNGACSWSQKTITGSSIGTTRNNIYLIFVLNNFQGVTLTSNDFVFSGGDIKFYLITDKRTATNSYYAFIDNMTGGYAVSTGTYISKSYDVGSSTNFVSISSIGITSNQYSPSITLQASNNNSTWRQLGSGVSSTSTFVGNRYYRYISSFTVFGSSDAFSTLDDVQIISRSTGTWASSVKNASVGNWDTFQADFQNNDGSHSFYIRSSTGIFYSSASTNPSWSSVTNGGIPTVTVNPYFQIRDDFSITATTQNPILDSFTQNWFEGSASDKTYAIYHDNANWWSVASGTGATTNNRILKFNLLNPGWYIYDIGTGGMLVRSQSLYFGSVSSGKIFKFGDTDDDNGSAINSYWKSKDFSGASPFLDKNYTRFSSVYGAVSNSTTSIRYTIDGSSVTSYNVNLGSSTSSFIQKNVNLPVSATGKTISFEFGNNAANQYWEMFGSQVDETLKPWVPK